MKTLVAIALSLALPFAGLTGTASAQSAVEIHGGIAAVDCQTQTVVVNTVDGQQMYAAAGDAYAEVDSTDLPLCGLEGYVGAPATVWLMASGNRLVVTAVDVTGPVAVAPVTAEVVAPLPIWGVVLGTVVVTGLLYLVVHGPDSGYYLYPYYGAYYRHYYHPWYRHYAGFYPASAPIITVALPITGIVLGTVIVSGDAFLVSRDPVGHYYRYPYYGPYHQYYYRPLYRPYRPTAVQTYVNVAVRQGDPQWDAPARAMGSVYRAGHNVPSRQPQPVFHQLNNQAPHQPVFDQPNDRTPQQPQPAHRQPFNRTPQQPLPAFRQPNNPTPQQPQPAFRQQNNPMPRPTEPAFHQTTAGNSHRSEPTFRQPGGDSPGKQGRGKQCGGHQSSESDQSCSNRGR